MPRVRNRTGQARIIPEAGGRIVGDDEVFECPPERAKQWALQPGFEVEDDAPPPRRSRRTAGQPADEDGE